MVVADALGEVFDMVAILRQRRLRARAGLGGDLGLDLVMVNAFGALAVLVLGRAVPVARGLADEIRHEGRHHHAAVAGDAVEHVVGDVARVVAEREGVGMRPDQWGAGDVERVMHHLRRDMGEVDDHAELVHPAQHVLAEAGEAVMARGVGGGIAPVGGVVVAERHQAHAEIVIGVERVELAIDRRAVLDGHEQGDAPLGFGSLDIGGGEAGAEDVRVTLEDVAHQRDLGEREAGRIGLFRRDIGREELRRHLAGLHARDVGVALGMDLVEAVGGDIALRPGVLADDIGQVVMAVDQRDAVEQSERGGVGIVLDGRFGEGHGEVSVGNREPDRGRERAGRRGGGTQGRHDDEASMPGGTSHVKGVIPHALRHEVLLRRCGIVLRKRRLLVMRSRVCAAALHAAARTG